MRATDFDYLRPATLDEAVAAARGGAAVLAGGQSLIPALAMREREVRSLVDVSGLPDLRGLSVTEESIVVGAAEPLRTLETAAEARVAAPLLVHTVGTVGAMAIRSRCTLGGSLAWADPTSQIPAVLLALDASVRTTERVTEPLELLRGGLATGEIVTEVLVPRPGRHGWALEHVRRTHITWPSAGVAVLHLDEGIRLGLYGAARTSLLVEARSRSEALAAIEAIIEPFDDDRATAAYRRRVLPVLARRALDRAERMFHERG